MTVQRFGFAPDDPDLLTNLANALLQKKEFPEAIEHYREVVASALTTVKCAAISARRSSKAARATKVWRNFATALRIRPNNSDAAYSLGNAFLEQGEPGRSDRLFPQGDRLGSRTNIAAHYNLGDRAQPERSARPGDRGVRKTLRLQPEHADAQNNLAIALLKKGQVQDAIAAWTESTADPARTTRSCTTTSLLLCCKRRRRCRRRGRVAGNSPPASRQDRGPRSPSPGFCRPRRSRRFAMEPERSISRSALIKLPAVAT